MHMQRFGRIVQIYVTGIMLVTMGTALTVEYTTVGGLFSQIIPSTAIPIVIIIGVVSSIYTAYGGLHVSIITDQVQVTYTISYQTTLPFMQVQGSIWLSPLNHSCIQYSTPGSIIKSKPWPSHGIYAEFRLLFAKGID